MGHTVFGTSRRSAILDSAMAEFADHGYHGARIERIAAAARANKQLIFHYFGSKDGLYQAVVSRLFSTSAARGPSRATPLESIRECVTGIADWLAANPGAARALSECSGGVDVPAPAAEGAQAWVQLQVVALRGVIEDGQRKGFFRDDIDAQSIASVTLGSLVGQSVLAGSGAAAGSVSTGELLGRIIAEHCAWR